MDPASSQTISPRVAVIVPAYGVAHLVGEALLSLQRQTFTHWECVVVDDGAPDDVATAVAPYLCDRRIRFLGTRNGGVSTARNQAIAATTAPLVTLLDGDDLLRPDYLSSVVPVLECDADVRLVTCNARIFGAVPYTRLCVEHPQPADGTLAAVLDRTFNVYIGTTFRRADFDAIGGFDETMSQSEDFDLWVRLMMLGGKARYLDMELGEYRVRPGSASADAARMLRGNLRVYEKARDALAHAASSAPSSAPRPEVSLIQSLIARTRADLAFEQAIDRIIAGDTRHGLAQLRAASEVGGGTAGGPLWRGAMTAWTVLPALAAPMLRWRRKAHRRGASQAVHLPSLLEMET